MLMYFVMILWYIIHRFPLLVYLGHPHKLLVLVLCLFFLFFSWNVAENYIFLVTLLALGTWLFIFLLLLFGQHRWFLMGLFIGEHVFTIFFLISLTPFCLLYFFIMQIEKIRGAGLIKGGSLENAMVCRWRINILENVTCLFNFVQNYILVGTLLI